MTIQDLINLVEAKLNSLKTSYTLTTSSGNVEETFRLEVEIAETERTIQNLKTIV